MPRNKYSTLTEQMFYVLLALKEECHGMDIMRKVDMLTEGRIAIGPGTLYNLLEQFMSSGYIRETSAEGRKKNYILTESGSELLKAEVKRIIQQIQDYSKVFEEE